MIDAVTRQRVRERAGNCCEYCLIREEVVPSPPLHIEHVIARQHGGLDNADNLALACDRCNLYKGPNLTGIDPATGNLVILFHPRKENWADHFAMERGFIIGLTPTGRTTVRVLNMNATHRVKLREDSR